VRALRFRGTRTMHRVLALLLALIGVPAALSISVFLMEAPIRVGERSPRTIVAPDLIRVVDPVATDRARRDAVAAVEPVLVDDRTAKAAIVQRVRDAFDAVWAVRQPDAEGRQATLAEQEAALAEPLSFLSPTGIRLLTRLSDAQLQRVDDESYQIAQQLARMRISATDLPDIRDETVPNEIAVRSFPPRVAGNVVTPLLREAVQPTVRVDEAATADARDEAANQVAEVTKQFPPGAVIVAAGTEVGPVQYRALEQRGLQGSEPWGDVLRAVLLSLVVTLAVSAYLRTYRPAVWQATRRVVLLSVLFVGFSLFLEGVGLLAPAGSSGWHYLAPVGAVTMLATMLIDPPVGILSTVPATVLVAFEAQGDPGVVAFAAVAALISVPLVSRLSARGDLRRAAWRSTLAYIVLAGLFAAVFDGPRSVPVALLAGLGNGILTTMLVATGLPYLESLFGVITATGLLDLADRNHPLLRELEQKALGSYNHSIMVSTLCERACRAIGADALLASVAALYHDIGKVRRPYFFVENQFGVANPHDELEPSVSAVIIQEHVSDGITMAKAHRLPPEVVEGIATHHGTTLVSYFYRQALQEAKADQLVDDEHFRYKGRKPSSREMAVLMLADCCEGASRAAAQHNRNLSQAELEVIVRTLIAERVDDGQLDESALTFRDLAVITESFISTLVGVYHPRILYPDKPDADAGVKQIRPRLTRQPDSAV
jgi:cyclic-di-AMP phosphodiesterase PgpH